MEQSNYPKHIAIIPDGNRRWARERRLPVIEGHRRGAQILSKLISRTRELKIPVFSFWVFSTENWNREEKEVSGLMKLFERTIDANLKEAKKNQTRIVHIGRKDRLSDTLKNKILKAEEETKKFKEHYFVLALDYGGRDEVLRAVQRIQNLESRIQNLKQEDFEKYLDTKDLPYPNPDLVIRTSGECRTSGFMIWQAAYAEWIFYPKYFPDFTPNDLEKCISDYVARQRRFGR